MKTLWKTFKENCATAAKEFVDGIKDVCRTTLVLLKDTCKNFVTGVLNWLWELLKGVCKVIWAFLKMLFIGVKTLVIESFKYVHTKLINWIDKW